MGKGERVPQLHLEVKKVGPKSPTLRLIPPDIRPRIVILEVDRFDRFGMDKGGTEQDQRDDKGGHGQPHLSASTEYRPGCPAVIRT